MGPIITPNMDDDEQRRKMPTLIPRVATPQTGIPPVNTPQIGAQQQEYERLTKPGTEDAKPGWQQISNPVGRTFAGIGSTALGILAPRIAAMVPGTSAHHNQLVNEAAQGAGEESAYAGKQAQTAQANATAAHLNQETEDLQNPQDKPAANEVELFQQNPEQFKAYQTAKGVAEKNPANPQAGYAAAIADALKNGRDPNSDPHVQAWKGAIEATQKEQSQNRDDRAIAINQKLALGQPLTPEETAYKKAYDQYVKQTKVDPGVQRMQILVNGRPVDVVDPNNPENVIPMRTGEAIASHAVRPQSIPFSTEKNVTKAFTTGKPAEELNAFNTAIAHADLLGQAANALNNGDTRTLNSIRNKAKTEFGSADVSNFNTIAKIYTGEVTKAINAGHVTEGELKDVGATIPDNASPAQIAGAVKAFRQLMSSKVQMRKQQYEQGMQGKPNFGNVGAAPNQNDPLGIR